MASYFLDRYHIITGESPNTNLVATEAGKSEAIRRGLGIFHSQSITARVYDSCAHLGNFEVWEWKPADNEAGCTRRVSRRGR